MQPLIVHGMHGLGDNLHQRAVVRQLMRNRVVWLETPWPCLYHDLVGERLHLFDKGSPLRTQAKNAAREQDRFEKRRPPVGVALSVSYSPELVRRHGSVLAAMLVRCNCDVGECDFRLPVPDAWREKASVWLDRWQPPRPLLLYRPLNERSEWSGCRARNPDHRHYADLLAEIRDRFFVVSVADVEKDREWLVGADVRADAECHRGELDIEVIAALTSIAGMVYSPPGFAVVLAQAVGTPVCCIFGGYESSASFSLGAKFTPYLGIDPIEPCQCFRHDHACKKAIDMPAAKRRLQDFADAALAALPSGRIARPADRLAGPAAAVHE